jgi:hypothetical protein
MKNYLDKTTRELRLRKYSSKTVKVYVACVKNYLKTKRTNFDK